MESLFWVSQKVEFSHPVLYLRFKCDVLILFFPGTFITEWNDGAAMCESFLKDEESYRAVADRLVQISHGHAFDGWLINIENSLSVSKTFRQYLHLCAVVLCT